MVGGVSTSELALAWVIAQDTAPQDPAAQAHGDSSLPSAIADFK